MDNYRATSTAFKLKWKKSYLLTSYSAQCPESDDHWNRPCNFGRTLYKLAFGWKFGHQRKFQVESVATRWRAPYDQVRGSQRPILEAALESESKNYDFSQLWRIIGRNQKIMTSKWNLRRHQNTMKCCSRLGWYHFCRILLTASHQVRRNWSRKSRV